MSPRRGNSALYASFNYLASETKWNTTLIGWPGEIEYTAKKDNPQQDHLDAEGSAQSAPISVVNAEHYEDHAAEQMGDMVLTKKDRNALETILGKGDLCGGTKILPVWMASEAEGDLKEGEVTFKDQGRWTMYAQRGKPLSN